MSKVIKFKDDAKKAMLRGIDTLYDAVRITLGPKGRNVIIEQDFGYPLIINDGVTIAKAIELEDHFENMGASLIIEAATKTNDLVGDGTTTAIILACKLIKGGVELIKQGVSPVEVRKAFDDALPKLLQYIDDHSTMISSVEDLKKIAYISSNDEHIAEILKEAFMVVGNNGIINIEESKTSETYLEVVHGYMYDKGYASPYMVNNTEKNIAELINPFVLIINHKVTTMNELVPFLEVAISKNAPILVIVEDLESEVLNTVVLNKLRGVFNCVVTKAPYYGEKQRKTLEDLAIVTGATIVNSNLVTSNPENLLGRCSKAIVKKDTTTILEGSGDRAVIDERIESLKQQLIQETSNYEKDQLENRIAKINGVAGIIKVGATTETELEELRLRAEDALNACFAASTSGIVEGGGKVFYELSLVLEKLNIKKIILPLLEETLKQPFYQILENAGLDKEEVLSKLDGTTWYNAEKDIYGSNIQMGIIDPTSVEKICLTNACKIAGIFLTTECAITNGVNHKKEDNELI
ncbi:MAG: molecular chaperone GroEL [Bacilli bacterium]|nr:molecular chaperone GroEL [Bacilli bacterium]